MKSKLFLIALSSLLTLSAQSDFESLKRELDSLKRRVTLLEQENANLKKQFEVDRLIVKKELIVSDTGLPWENGFETHQMPRGIYAKTFAQGTAGLWVRSRLIKGEIDDPFDDRFHALEKDGSIRRSPGHISWNVFIDGAWRQMAIIQGEGLEPTELPLDKLTGSSHPGRLRFQTFRPGHPEPLTDALIGQGMMSLGGGGFGGGGLPYPNEVLQLWGGELQSFKIATPSSPRILKDDSSGDHQYSLIAIGPQGHHTPPSPPAHARGRATLQWDNLTGADSYIIIRDTTQSIGPLRLEGAQKQWTDSPSTSWR